MNFRLQEITESIVVNIDYISVRLKYQRMATVSNMLMKAFNSAQAKYGETAIASSVLLPHLRN